MKWLVAISLIVFLVVVGFVTAESTIPRMTCPICKKLIAEGAFVVQQFTKEQQVLVHFNCAYEDMMKFKWEQVKQAREGK